MLTLLGEKESSYAALPIFNIFLSACSTNLNDAESCLEKMENHLLGKSEITYCELLKVCMNNCSILPIYDLQKFSFISGEVLVYQNLPVATATMGRHNHP